MNKKEEQVSKWEKEYEVLLEQNGLGCEGSCGSFDDQTGKYTDLRHQIDFYRGDDLVKKVDGGGEYPYHLALRRGLEYLRSL